MPGTQEASTEQALGAECVGDEPDLGIIQAGMKSKLHCGLAKWPWARDLISLCFSFSVSKVGGMMIISQGYSEF